jgi:hypothetical protein
MIAGLRARREWVSTTDLSRWYRCPYAFWLLDSGQISFAETISPFQACLIQGGHAYQNAAPASPARSGR